MKIKTPGILSKQKFINRPFGVLKKKLYFRVRENKM